MSNPSTPPPPATDALARLQQQADDYLKGWQRAKADYLNLKKQSEQEKVELAQFANAALLSELLPLFDHLKRACRHVPADQRGQEWVKGFEHILTQFRQWFQKFGVEEVATQGRPFDPAQHEAVAREHRADVPDQQILEELATGFCLNGKVLLPAKVKVNVHSTSTTTKGGDI